MGKNKNCAHVEGLLEHVVDPGDLFRSEAREPCELHRIGLCVLREALSSKCPVRREAGEGAGEGGK